MKSHSEIYFTLRDHQFDSLRRGDSNTGDQCVSISLDIVHSPRDGIAYALNHGLGYCRADLVARMDADDVATPQRLLSQIRCMHTNPSFAAVGMSMVLFSTKNGKQDHRFPDMILPYDSLSQNAESCSVLRPSLSISDPGFMAWAMFLTCSISRP